MNEASKFADLLPAIRKRLPGSKVFKHADVGMVGLPDASITWHRVTLWLEGKLHQPARHGAWTSVRDALAYFQQKAPTQAAQCQGLAREGYCLYIIWRKHIPEIYLLDPFGDDCWQFATTSQVVDFIADRMQAQSGQ